MAYDVAAPVRPRRASRRRGCAARRPTARSLEHVVRDAGAAGVGEELGAEADQTAGGDQELHADPAGAVVGHLLHAALADGEELGDRAEVLLAGRVDGQALDGLVQLAVDLPGDHLRLADGELVALAPHLLDEDRQGELATALDLPGVGTLGRDDLDRHVADELAVQAVLDQARGDLRALDPAGQRGGVGADRHRDGRLVDGDQRQRDRALGVGEGLADHDLGDARDRDDVAGAGLLAGLRSSASVTSSSVIFTFWVEPSRFIQATVLPFFSSPSCTRTSASRPRNGLASRLVTWARAARPRCTAARGSCR